MESRSIWLVLLGATIASFASGQNGKQSQSVILPSAARPVVSAALGRDIQRYGVRSRDGVLSTDNGQNLAADFTPSGVQVHRGNTLWGMRMAAYGYGNDLRAVDPAPPQATGNRVEYRRGSLTEWYVNGPLGLEQGFTIAQPPGQSHGRPLTVALALSGDFTPTLDESGTSLTLISRKGGANLRYAGLTAYDSTGKTLQARLVLEAQQVLIRVGDTEAKYPLVIDPFIEVAQITSSDSKTDDWFGNSVAFSGNTLVIGAPGNGGAAYVFVEPATGWATTSTFVARLSASDGAASDAFGSSVAISGNTIFVGANNAAVGPNLQQGATYIFVEPATGWATMTQTAKLTASDGKATDGFGQSVSISGPKLVVGAAGWLASTKTPGAAYLFVRPSSGWATTSTFRAKLTPSDGAAGDLFGYGVAINQDTVVVGAPGQGGGYGSAYVFVKPTTGWKSSTETGKLVPSDASTVGAHGNSVAVSGNTIAVGAPGSGGGAVYVFLKPPTGWTTVNETAKLTASDVLSGAALGSSVAIGGNAVAAGAPNRRFGQYQTGAIYLFLRPATGWSNMTQTFRGIGSVDDRDEMGLSVAFVGNSTVVAGGPRASNFTGAAYILKRMP